MLLKKWEELPLSLQTDSVKPYYDVLCQQKNALRCKRVFDASASLVLLAVLSPVFVGLGLAVHLDSEGEILFRQTRITQYGKEFSIYKFRTMVSNAAALGTQVTTKDDRRITRIGHFLRRCRLDEIPQLLNILKGEMSFVGTRPEVPDYVAGYTAEMMATLLLPAGVTSTASIEYKDEDKLLADAKNAELVYLQQVLPAKMRYNLEYLKNFRFTSDLTIILRTITNVLLPRAVPGAGSTRH